MVRKELQNKCIKAIQDLIIEGRTFAYKRIPHLTLSNFMDDLEYLPGLLLVKEDRTKEFEDYLKHICIKFGCDGVWNRYLVR